MYWSWDKGVGHNLTNKKKGILSNLIYETIITTIPKPDKDITVKGNCRQYAMYMDAKVLNKILAN